MENGEMGRKKELAKLDNRYDLKGSEIRMIQDQAIFLGGEI